MKTVPNRFSGVRHGTLLDAGHFVRVEYTKVMVWSSITLGSTGKVRCETYQLVWSVAMQIESVNHLGTKLLNHMGLG